MKNKVYLLIGVAMLVFAVGFIWYAMNNPQASFPWSNPLTYAIYGIYAVITVAFFVLYLRQGR